MNIKGRLERMEAAQVGGACPCQTPVLIEIVDASASVEDSEPCAACGSPRPVSRIEAVRPEGYRS
jgi:hypothetical protein